MVRDSSYADWLYSLGVKVCQLTLFGTEETTDYFIGRKGAYQEIIKAINILLEHNIAPRLQIYHFIWTILFDVLLHWWR